MFFIGTLSQTLTLRALVSSSTYLLPQIPGPACLNPPNPLFKGAHQAFVRTRAHGHRFAVLRPASDDALVALRSEFFALLCATVPNSDVPYGLFFLHVFAAATGWTKSPLLPTSLDSRVQIRPFCPRRPSLILSRTAARTVAIARSAQGASQFAAGYASVRRAA